MSGSHAEGVHVELFVRSLAPRGSGGPQEDVVATLERLTDREIVSTYTVTVCGKEVPAATDDAVTPMGLRLVECIASFEEWAERNDRTLAGVFESRRVDSSITGESYVCRVAPMLALAEYEGTDLRFVAPSAAGGDRVSVRDRLDDLERADATTDVEPIPDARDAELQRSPTHP